ncbi:RNA polymerase sigma factor [candidate division KSB1 bacterium]
MDETDLIKRMLEGDHDAFTSLVNAFKDTVFNVCFGFVKNREEAEDITQEVFLSIYNSLHTLCEGEKLRVWVYRIAVNKSLNTIRKNRRMKVFRLFSPRFEREESGIENLKEPAEADRRVLSENRIALIKKALDTLPDTQRTAFTLHTIDEFSYGEIAEIMKCSVPAVESRIHRAKINLQKKLIKYIYDLR